MKRSYTNKEINEALDNLSFVLNELKVTSYTNSLYTQVHPDANYDGDISDSDGSVRDFILLESIIKDTSYKLLDAIEIVIRVLFEWDYILEARFDITIDSKLSIIFHKPVVQYEIDVYDCNLR